MQERAPFTVSQLIEDYRTTAGEPPRSEDARHARCEVKLRELEQVLERTLAEGRAVDAPVRGARR